MAELPNKEIAICGAGLAGLGMALALHSQQIPCRIYEALDTPERFGGGSINLGPNALTVFDRYGILDRLESKGYTYERAKIMDGKGNPINELITGDKQEFGYSGLRITRRTLVKEFVDTVQAHGIPIECRKRIVSVTDESQAGVHFEFSDGTSGHASILVAADGIYSRIRRQLFPSVEPEYLGALIVGGTMDQTDMLRVEPDKNVLSNSEGMFLGDHGTFLLSPENAEKSVYMAALQRPYPDIGRSGWETWLSDETKVDPFFDETREDWPKFIGDNIETLKSKLDWHWPVRSLPRLEKWTSVTSRVVLIGDAAHAMPPAAGQGANMAFEDGYTMALVLAQMRPGTPLEDAMSFWQQIRQERMDAILTMTMQLNKLRLPTAERQKLRKGESYEGGETETERLEKFRWLYQGVPVQEEKIRAWAK